MKLERVRYLGLRVRCPICAGRFRSFAPEEWDGTRWHGPSVRCPACGSRPRHRFLWLYLLSSGLLAARPSLLHIAPEPFLVQHIRERAGSYTSADLDPARGEVQADLTALPFDSEAFDLVLCSHVLEHVPDDRAAMTEMRRVLRPGGVALVQTPVNYEQAGTYEDPAADDPADRLARFSQVDHVRVFGPDLRDRLEAAGFEVGIVAAADLGEAAVRWNGLEAHRPPLRNDLYRCHRPQ